VRNVFVIGVVKQMKTVKFPSWYWVIFCQETKRWWFHTEGSWWRTRSIQLMCQYGKTCRKHYSSQFFSLLCL